MTTEKIVQMDKDHVMQTYGRFPVAIERGEGAKLYSPKGKEYIDFTSGIGVCSIGHAHPAWQKAIADQAAKLGHISNLFYTEPGTLLADRLCAKTGMKSVFFANSGAEANEGAIKLARKYSFDRYGKGRHTIVTLQDSFHGRTVTTLAATGQDKFHNYFFPFTDGFHHVPAGDLEVLKTQGGDVCAVMVEVVQGEGGVLPLDKGYLEGLRALCDERDWLLIFDEVQTGVGRTGSLYAFQQTGVTPDVLTSAKGLAGGLPLGAVLAGERCAEVLTAGTHATTFGANPVCCAAALATLEVLDGVIPEVSEKGAALRRAIEEMKSPFVKGTRGAGLMIGVVIEGEAPARLAGAMIEQGLLVLTAGADAVRLLPPLTITQDEMAKGLAIMKKVLCPQG